jgi:hypothetical protein
MDEVVDIKKIQTAEELLSFLRKGNAQKFEIGYEGWMVPCRLLSAGEMLKISIRSSQAAKLKTPNGANAEQFIAIETMVLVLDKATTIEGAPNFAMGFLEGLPETILSDLYDQFLTINNAINPSIQHMKPEDIKKLVEDVKKNKTTTKNYYTYQLAEVGKFFLTEILPVLLTDNDVGTP